MLYRALDQEGAKRSSTECSVLGCGEEDKGRGNARQFAAVGDSQPKAWVDLRTTNPKSYGMQSLYTCSCKFNLGEAVDFQIACHRRG